MLSSSAPRGAESMRVRRYRVPEGLAHNSVRVIKQDSKGYLWIGTGEGVSRFDGYRFVNYSTSEGLTVPLVNDILEDARGRIWVATNGAGLALFLDDVTPSGAGDRAGRARTFFRPFQLAADTNANQINALAHINGVIWCATDGGLFRGDISAAGEPSFTRAGPNEAIDAMTTTPDGKLVFAGSRGLSIRQNDRVEDIGWPQHDRSEVQDVAVHSGRLYVLTAQSLHAAILPQPPAAVAWITIPVPPTTTERKGS